MRDTTRKVILLALEGDTEATKVERDAVRAALDARNATPTNPEPLDRVLTRKQVAAIFGKCEKWVDWEARRPGTKLERVYLGGVRCAGYSEKSVRAALTNRKGDKADGIPAAKGGVA